MKNVWILNHYAQVPSGPGGTRHFSLAKYMVEHGWRATIIASSVELNTGRQRLARGQDSLYENVDGVPFLWLRTPAYQGDGLGRIRNMSSYAWRALRPAMTACLPAPDAVIGSSVHPLAALSGALIAKRHGVPFLFEVRDLWPQALIDLGRLSHDGPPARLLRALEGWLYRRAVRTLVLQPKADEYIASFGVAPEKIVWLPHGIDLAISGAPRELVDRDDFTVMYLGAHGQSNALDVILLAMAKIGSRGTARRVRLRMIGNGGMKPALMERAATLGLGDAVSFESALAKHDVPATAAEADAFIVSFFDLPNLYRFGINMNKFYDYMAAGRPIIIASAAANDPIAEAGAGLSVPPEDPEALADAIESLARMPLEARRRFAVAARDFVVANHDYAVLATRLVEVLNGCVAGRSC